MAADIHQTPERARRSWLWLVPGIALAAATLVAAYALTQRAAYYTNLPRGYALLIAFGATAVAIGCIAALAVALSTGRGRRALGIICAAVGVVAFAGTIATRAFLLTFEQDQACVVSGMPGDCDPDSA